MHPAQKKRREIVTAGASVGFGLLLASISHKGIAKKAEPEGIVPLSPTEELMREHGLLGRLLLVYEKACKELASGGSIPLKSIGDSAIIIQEYIHDHHEKMEENYLFPRFKKFGQHLNLVDTLHHQHDIARRLTGEIINLCRRSSFQEAEARRLAELMQKFVTMYRPHEGQEETVVFPAFQHLVSRREWEDLSHLFGEDENQHFGKGGFQEIVGQVAAIEKSMGLDRLEQFTAS